MTLPRSVGRYTITEELGRGAMGVVYRAVDPTLDRPVAVKAIAARTAAIPLSAEELEARFVREARMASRINHPGVVTVYDAGRDGDLLYLVMELVEGESLAARLARREFPPPSRALEIVACVADALGAAHALGVVHRDVKPGNIVLAKDGRVKVADFGVAKAIGEDTNLTRTGTVVGSPAYMAPEQVRGEELDGRADLFSLGVVLYELLLRRKPFPADTVTTLIYQILHEDPLADPQVLATLGEEPADLLRRCLAKRREHRIPDASAFAAAARALATQLASAAAEPTAPTEKLPVAAASHAPTASGGRGRFGFPVAAVAVAGIVLVGFAALLGVRHLGRSPAQPLQQSAAPTAVSPPANKGVASSPPVATVARRPTRPRRAVTPTDSAPARVATPEPEASPPVPAPPLQPPPRLVGIFYCQRGADFNVSPQEAVVSVGGKAIGKAAEWNGRQDGRTFVFPGPGSYLVKLSLAGYRDTWVKVVVDPGAADETADVDTALAGQ